MFGEILSNNVCNVSVSKLLTFINLNVQGDFVKPIWKLFRDLLPLKEIIKFW